MTAMEIKLEAYLGAAAANAPRRFLELLRAFAV